MHGNSKTRAVNLQRHTHIRNACGGEHAVADTRAAEGQVAAAPGLTIDALTFDKGGK